MEPDEYVRWLVAIDAVAAGLTDATVTVRSPDIVWRTFVNFRRRLLDDYATRLGYPPGDLTVPGQADGDHCGPGNRHAGGPGAGGPDAEHDGQDAGLSARPHPAEPQAAAEPGADDHQRATGPKAEAADAPNRHGEAPPAIRAYVRTEGALRYVNTSEPPQEA